ncbi:MAG: hypothetical protein UY72_C0019G0001, partial [Candidatus Uhrbacteria bacterium GW2011_GWD2_52_7]
LPEPGHVRRDAAARDVVLLEERDSSLVTIHDPLRKRAVLTHGVAQEHLLLREHERLIDREVLHTGTVQDAVRLVRTWTEEVDVTAHDLAHTHRDHLVVSHAGHRAGEAERLLHHERLRAINGVNHQPQARVEIDPKVLLLSQDASVGETLPEHLHDDLLALAIDDGDDIRTSVRLRSLSLGNRIEDVATSVTHGTSHSLAHDDAERVLVERTEHRTL